MGALLFSKPLTNQSNRQAPRLGKHPGPPQGQVTHCTAPGLHQHYTAERGTGTASHLHILLFHWVERNENEKSSIYFKFSWKLICPFLKSVRSDVTSCFPAERALSQRVLYQHRVSNSRSAAHDCHLLAQI